MNKKITDYRLQVTAIQKRLLRFLFPHSTPYTLAPRRGVTTILVLIFLLIFVMLLAGLTGFALEESRYGRAIAAREEALHMADAGLEYYRWFLSHFPNDTTNGTGTEGSFTYPFIDPETNLLVGTALITATSTKQCGVTQWIDITSVGKSTLDPTFSRALTARYMKPSAAKYSYMLNSNVWAGSSRNITGPYFSNGGIRMDGTNNSDVLSAQPSWACNGAFGCTPTTTQNGVFGAGTGSLLWNYPVATVDFNGITTNLNDLKGYAQSISGRYFGPLAVGLGNANQRGYHLIFKSDGTFDLYRVNDTVLIRSGTDDIYGGKVWQDEYSIISTTTPETIIGTNYTIPASCSVIFLEDRAWIEGVVKGKVTVAAADFINLGHNPDVYIPNNITYVSATSSGLTIIAEGNLLLPLNSPDTMEIHGIFAAQKGMYGRRYYTSSGSPSSNRVPSFWTSSVVRTQLTTGGSIVSNLRTGTQWGSSSGYQTRIDAYDELQALAPPPFTPFASPQFQFISWQEI
jgi:Tfp pilus assembly protein PilX